MHRKRLKTPILGVTRLLFPVDKRHSLATAGSTWSLRCRLANNLCRSNPLAHTQLLSKPIKREEKRLRLIGQSVLNTPCPVSTSLSGADTKPCLCSRHRHCSQHLLAVANLKLTYTSRLGKFRIWSVWEGRHPRPRTDGRTIFPATNLK